METAAADKLHPKNHGFNWTPVRGPFQLVSEEQAQAYNQRGFFVLENVLDRSTVDAVRAAIDPLEAAGEELLRKQPGGKMFIAQADGITFTTHLVRRSRLLRDFAASPTFVKLCCDLIGPDVRLYWDQAVYKKPEYPKPFPWHQDNGYTFVEPQAYLTCWIPLSDATVDNGCPWVIDGGHLKGTLAHRLTELGWVCREEDGGGAIAVPVRTGDIVVFSSLTPHRTGPNLTRQVRKTYILQYAPDGARIVSAGTAGDGGQLCDAPDRQFVIAKNGKAVAPPRL